MPFTKKKHAREMDEAVTRAARDARRHASEFADRLGHKTRRKTCRRKAEAHLEDGQGYLEDVRDFTRRNPLSVVAGAVVTGAVLATVLRRGR